MFKNVFENFPWNLKLDSWPAIVISWSVWSLCYLTLRALLPSKGEEYSCRIVSAIHGAIAAFGGINQCFVVDWPFDHPEWVTNDTQKFLMVSSLGYFIYDLIWCLVYQRDSKLMIAHHIYSVVTLWQMLHKGYSGAQATCALGSMELTNPLLQIRWFLRSEGYYPSTLFTSVEITFMIFFFLIRILLGSYFLFIIMRQPKNDRDFKLLSLSIYVMSWMFMFKILQYFHRKYPNWMDVHRLLGSSNTPKRD